MFDIGWSELGLLAVIAFLVVGPKDLPRMMRVLGRLMGRARALAGEFRVALDQLAREAELDDIRKKAGDMAKLDPAHMLQDAIDPDGQMANSILTPGQDTPSNPAKKPRSKTRNDPRND